MNTFALDSSHECGCGKIYQSFLALRNHCKNKHSGKFPSGTQTDKTNRRKIIDMRNLQNIEYFYKEFKERVSKYSIENTPRKCNDKG
jgi:hypothetical protein